MEDGTRSVVKCIYEHSLHIPDKIAVIGTDCTVNYKTFWQYIMGASQLLKERALKQGDRVIVEAGPTVEYLTCCFAIHLCGAVCVPVENGAPESRVQEIAHEVEASLILTGWHPFEQMGCNFESLKGIDNTGYKFPAEHLLQDILFTTGTTGKSKGVMISHFGLMNMCEAENEFLNYSDNNIWLIPTPMNHGGGIRRTYMSMVKGSTVVLMNGFKNLKLFFDNIKRYHVTSIYIPPTAIHYILLLASKELSKYDNQLDFLYTASAPLTSEDKDNLIKLLPHVRKFNSYASTEVSAVACIDYNATPVEVNCVGRPYPGVKIFTVDDELNPFEATKDKPGIIAIKNNTCTLGYWNEPELTMQTIRNGIIYMSDIGYISKEGYLYLMGRRDDVINVGGLKVAPIEVEDVALHFPGVSECVCVPFGDKISELCIKMFIVLKEDSALNTEQLASYLKSKLESYKIPRFIEIIDEIPKTFNGKVDRKKMINMAKSGFRNK